MKLALGTVQFGLDYGVTGGVQVGPGEIGRILGMARAGGMDTLDTAVAYGTAEQALGAAGLDPGWHIVTKLPPVPDDTAGVDDWARAQIDGSLARLGRTCVDAVLLHRTADLWGPHGAALADALHGLKRDGLARRVGVSIYEPEDLDALAGIFTPDLVQVPFNALDRRLENSGWADRLAGQGTAVHLRSVFLQGLLLTRPEALPPRFAAHRPVFDAWWAHLDRAGVSPLAGALGAALSRSWAERVVIGVDSAAQLQQILDAADETTPFVPVRISSSDPALIDPREWT